MYQLEQGQPQLAEKYINDLLPDIDSVVIQNVILTGITKIEIVEQENDVAITFLPNAFIKFSLREYDLQITLQDDGKTMNFYLKRK